MDYSTQFFAVGTFFCPPRCPARPNFFSQPHACNLEKMAKKAHLSWANCTCTTAKRYLRGPAHSPGVLQPTLPNWLTTPKSHVAPQQGRLGTQMAGPARDPGLVQLPVLHGWCWLGAAAPSLGALCLDLPSCLSLFIG